MADKYDVRRPSYRHAIEKEVIFRSHLLSVILTLSIFGATPTAPTVLAQSSNIVDDSGLPAFRTYFSPDDYSAYHQIWAITSDSNNRVYIGTAEGVSVYDNADWNLITTRSNTTVRSLDYGFRNQVYVGLQGDIGAIAPDSSGQLEFESLLDRSKDLPDFGNVWETHATDNGVYFQSSQYLAYWDGDSLQWVHSEAGYHTSFKLGPNVIVKEKTVGLVEFDGKRGRVLPHSEYFSDKRVFVLENVSEGVWFVGTRDNGFYYLYSDGLAKIETDIDELVIDNWIYGGVRLSDELIGVYTLGAGLLVIRKNGKLVRSLSVPIEISDRYILSAHLDQAGSLWLGTMNSGIERYDTNVLSLSMYDESVGIDGYIYDVQSTDRMVVVSTGSGLHISERGRSNSNIRSVNHFRRIEAVPIAWESAIVHNTIYTVSDAGVFRIENSRVDTLSQEQSFSIDATSGDLNAIFVGGKGKIQVYVVNHKSGRIVRDISIPVDGEIDIVDWDEEDLTLWANVKNSRVISYVFNSTLTKYTADVKHEYEASDSDVNMIFKLDNDWYYSTKRTINRYSSSLDKFVEDDICEILCNDEIMAVDVTTEGEIWIVYPDSVVSSSRDDDDVRDWYTHNDLKYHRSSTGALQLTKNGVLYLSERSRLYRYDTSIPEVRIAHSFSVVINEVRPARTDTVFYGVFTDGHEGIGSVQPDHLVPVVSFDQRDITIRASSTKYSAAGQASLSYKYNNDSDTTWVEVPDNTFTVSPSREGTYTINIRARDELGRESAIASYSFIVTPPWYRTWWAYGSYILFFVFLVYVSRKYHRLRQAQRQAEEQAKELERERVVVRKLQEANERLKEANKLKDEFLATTSHELRTPLTAILGFTSVLKEEVPHNAAYREFLDIIEDSGERLMDTLNSLLDLAKMRAGILEIRNERIDLNSVLAEVVSNMSDRADKKGLYLRKRTSPKSVYVEADMYALKRILYNLLSNAIKFTEEGGVTVSVGVGSAGRYLRIADTGVGIDEAFVPKIFDEFIQESDGLARAYEGSGLGLAISGKLIHMLGAKLQVNSKKGEGSVFEVLFPSVSINDENTVVSNRLSVIPSAKTA